MFLRLTDQILSDHDCHCQNDLNKLSNYGFYLNYLFTRDFISFSYIELYVLGDDALTS